MAERTIVGVKVDGRERCKGGDNECRTNGQGGERARQHDVRPKASRQKQQQRVSWTRSRAGKKNKRIPRTAMGIQR